jgi:hypothetical protein
MAYGHTPYMAELGNFMLNVPSKYHVFFNDNIIFKLASYDELHNQT